MGLGVRVRVRVRVRVLVGCAVRLGEVRAREDRSALVRVSVRVRV